MISENEKTGAFGTPIPAEDIASTTKKTFGIGSGDGGPSIDLMGPSNPGDPLKDSSGDISRGCP